MKLDITRFAAMYPYGYFVQWTLSNVGPADAGEFRFTLERSGGSSGPWTEVMAAQDQYAFEDRFNAVQSTLDELQPNGLRFFQEIHYRVTATSLLSGRVVSATEGTGPHDASRRMQMYLRKGQNYFSRTLRYNGTPIAILKKRRWGPRCPKCFDKRTKEVIRPNCSVCWATGFVGGYWAPVYSKARRNVSSNASAVTANQKSDSNDASFWLAAYPSLEKDDILISMSDQRRFRCDVRLETEIQLNAVHQEVTAQELPHDHVMMQYPVNFAGFPDTYGDIRP